ncbi:MAG: cytochrome P460 family protein, partial [Acidobacteriota bacterium]|nr:cytochrome P460 family protein [Acidobacteriota bacterium]
TGYREWVFIGSSLGMGYRDGGGGETPAFHNVYIQPEAYRIYAATGTFPDKTMLVMELLTAGAEVSINKQGKFEDRFLGIEISVKDESHFPEKWAYFNFIGEGGAELTQAKPIAKEACWSCHNAHAAADNVFVQFYPILKAARKR